VHSAGVALPPTTQTRPGARHVKFSTGKLFSPLNVSVRNVVDKALVAAVVEIFLRHSHVVRSFLNLLLRVRAMVQFVATVGAVPG
jgi:hypothetical protein